MSCKVQDNLQSTRYHGPIHFPKIQRQQNFSLTDNVYQDDLRLENVNEELELSKVKKKLRNFPVQEEMSEINIY